MAIRWIKASLRISSDRLDPEEIESTMTTPAWKKHAKGQPYSERDETARRKESLCIFQISAGEESAWEDHFVSILEFVRGHSPGLKRLAGSCVMDVLVGCGSTNGQLGFALTHQQMRQLGEHKLDCVFDIYPGSDEDT